MLKETRTSRGTVPQLDHTPSWNGTSYDRASRRIIVTATLNPSWDIYAWAKAPIRADDANRVEVICAAPGGKPLNASRIIAKIGGETVAILPLGGLTGEKIQKRLVSEGISLDVIRISGETRENFFVQDPTGAEYRFHQAGPTLSREELKEIVAVKAS